MKVYTTGEVAKICEISVRTVVKWIEIGELKSFKIPGSKHRRIPHQFLVKFLREKMYPLDGLSLDLNIYSLLVTKNTCLASQFGKLFPKNSKFKTEVADNSYDVAIRVFEHSFDFIILDFTSETSLIIQLYKILSERKITKKINFFALITREQRTQFHFSRFIEVLEKPFDLELLKIKLENESGLVS